ncbi:unnamed protein product [Pylaiella littoralis]
MVVHGVPSADVITSAPINPTTTRAQPLATKETRKEVGDDENESAAVSESERARAAGVAARAAARDTRAAVAVAARRAQDAKLRLEELRKHSGNSRCADCGAPCADWASVAHGSFVCLNCAGQHRSLGMHVVFTRPLTMENWTEKSLDIMEVGGNKRLAEFVRRVGLSLLSPIEDKYLHPCLRLYRKHIVALADGKDPPPILREALEKAVLTASGEEASDDGNGDKDEDSSRSLDISGGCGRLGDALRRWSGRGPISKWTQGAGGDKAGLPRGRMATRWVPDDEKEACMLCERKFTFVLRRHHCRRCGRLSCKFCAPANNTRPIVEWNYLDAVRHCRLCYRSPVLEWPDGTDRSDTARAAPSF